MRFLSLVIKLSFGTGAFQKTKWTTPDGQLESPLPMKQNPIGAILVGLLFVCAVLTTWMAVRYYFSVKELAKLQGQFTFVNNTWSAVQALANDAVQYSKQYPAIDPILQQFDLKPKPATAIPPASKPAR